MRELRKMFNKYENVKKIFDYCWYCILNFFLIKAASQM